MSLSRRMLPKNPKQDANGMQGGDGRKEERRWQTFCEGIYNEDD